VSRPRRVQREFRDDFSTVRLVEISVCANIEPLVAIRFGAEAVLGTRPVGTQGAGPAGTRDKQADRERRKSMPFSGGNSYLGRHKKRLSTTAPRMPTTHRHRDRHWLPLRPRGCPPCGSCSPPARVLAWGPQEATGASGTRRCLPALRLTLAVRQWASCPPYRRPAINHHRERPAQVLPGSDPGDSCGDILACRRTFLRPRPHASDRRHHYAANATATRANRPPARAWPPRPPTTPLKTTVSAATRGLRPVDEYTTERYTFTKERASRRR
jgi:hypothetical protein